MHACPPTKLVTREHERQQFGKANRVLVFGQRVLVRGTCPHARFRTNPGQDRPRNPSRSRQNRRACVNDFDWRRTSLGRPGDFHEDRIRTAPTAQRELGYAVRELIQRTGLSSLACVAAKLEEKSQERCEALRKLANERPLSSDEEKQLKERRYFSKTALWELVHGIRKRPPGEAQLKALYELAYGDDGTEEGWNELNGRRRALANQSTRSGSVADENHQLPTICPACGGTRPERGARAMAKPAEIRSAIASAVAGPPPARGPAQRQKDRLGVAARCKPDRVLRRRQS